ncbi:MAG: response regulator transcription factor [Elusimicrobia bacterium]|nr:response regulator transcription factor [Elusimicrobiota bacterium]
MPDKVLVVDDEEDFRVILRDVLERAGFEVLLASNGQEGLEALQKTPVSVAIVDWMMPVMDGIALSQWIRRDAHLRYTPLILLTVKSAAEEQLEGFHVGADDYVVKPFRPEDLVARIRNLLRRSAT